MHLPVSPRDRGVQPQPWTQHSGRATYLRDVPDDDGLELVAMLLEELAQVPSLALRAHGAAHGEPCLEEGFDDPYSDVAVRACDEDLS